MKTNVFAYLFSILIIICFVGLFNKKSNEATDKPLTPERDIVVKKKKKTEEERKLFVEERLKHEFDMQKNPLTGKIPLEEKEKELKYALSVKKNTATLSRSSSLTYTSRGPSNLGGRTRAIRVDLSDATSNIILAGGVSSGLFRTVDGGTTWTKVSPNDDIHNVTALAQDPRLGFQNIWYYGTGERQGNSASLGSAYRGRGVWKSIDGGLTWVQIAATDSLQHNFDSDFDYISALEVSPLNGHVFIGAGDSLYRYDGTGLTEEFDEATGDGRIPDVVITSTGRVYAAFYGAATDINGVWTSPTGNGFWTRIAKNAIIGTVTEPAVPANWSTTKRIVLGVAPSNDDIIYALYVNGQVSDSDTDSYVIEADLWQYNFATSTWTDYSSKLPDEPGGDLIGNDPFAVQGGYDLVVSVKPDDENFVVIGGTNAYKIADITTDATFTRIGGYASNTTYAGYTQGGDEHHSDVHEFYFDPNNPNIMFSGTDGGVHKTADITAATVQWIHLNNDYLTYQYYHVALDPQIGSNIVFGGAQDNGTTQGGTDAGFINNTEMFEYYGGDGVAVGIARRNGGTELQYYYGTQNGNMRTNRPSFRYIYPVDGNGDRVDSQFVTYFYLDPDNNNALYYAGRSVLYKTDDAENVTKTNWDNLGGLSTGEDIKIMSTTRGAYSASSYLLIGGDDGGIFRLSDPQNATSPANDELSAVNITPPGAALQSGTVTGLAIHPTNPNIVLATYSNYNITNIYLTTNAMDASPVWTVVENNLPNHSIRSAAVTVVNGVIIYFVGTARGLYSSTDPTSTDWVLEGGDEIGLPLISGLVYRPSDNKLLIGTHGNGMYETTITTAALSVEEVSNNDLDVIIYPNPVLKELHIRGSWINYNDVTYQIFDLTGKLVKKGTLIDLKVNVMGLNTGIYIINLSSEGRKRSVKFLKE